jgi:hypothetical protein
MHHSRHFFRLIVLRRPYQADLFADPGVRYEAIATNRGFWELTACKNLAIK